MNRRGFSLIELVALLPMLAAVAVVLSAMFPTLVRDVPRLQEVTQTDAAMMHMLGQMQRDVDAAVGLAVSSENPKLFLIRQPSREIVYRVEHDRVAREVRPPGKDKTRKPEIKAWDTPGANISFLPLRQGNKTYAVAVQTAVKYHIRSTQMEKLANCRVFFLPTAFARRAQP